MKIGFHDFLLMDVDKLVTLPSYLTKFSFLLKSLNSVLGFYNSHEKILKDKKRYLYIFSTKATL